jgi:thioredoxin-related protein
VQRLNFNTAEGQALAQQYRVNGHPTIILLDRSGTVAAALFGVPDQEQLVQQVQTMLDQP